MVDEVPEKETVPYRIGKRTFDLTKAMAVYRYDYELCNGKMRFYIAVILRGGLLFDDGFYSKRKRDYIYDELQSAIKRLHETFKNSEDL